MGRNPVRVLLISIACLVFYSATFGSPNVLKSVAPASEVRSKARTITLEDLKCNSQNTTATVHELFSCAMRVVGFSPSLEPSRVRLRDIPPIAIATYLSHWGARGMKDMTCYALRSILAHGMVPNVHGLRKGTTSYNKLAGLAALTAEYPRYTLLVVYDAVDVLMMAGNETVLRNTYGRMGDGRIVVSTEKFLTASQCGDGYRGAYPNTGLWMGPAGLLHELFSYLAAIRSHLMKNRTDDWIANDQRLFTCLWPRLATWRANIILDERSQLFQSMFDGTWPMASWNHDVVGNKPPGLRHHRAEGLLLEWLTHRRNLKYGTSPLFFHFNVIPTRIKIAFDYQHLWLPPTKGALPPFRVGRREVEVVPSCGVGGMSERYPGMGDDIHPNQGLVGHALNVWVRRAEIVDTPWVRGQIVSRNKKFLNVQIGEDNSVIRVRYGHVRIRNESPTE